MYISTEGIEHSLGESKLSKNLSVSKEEIEDFIANKHRMVQYYNPRKEDFIFATEKAKFIVTPNYEMKINDTKLKLHNRHSSCWQYQ